MKIYDLVLLTYFRRKQIKTGKGGAIFNAYFMAKSMCLYIFYEKNPRTEKCGTEMTFVAHWDVRGKRRGGGGGLRTNSSSLMSAEHSRDRKVDLVNV